MIELLVVIAIIGILAAMLFPVFARARESARKIQCLSNVKNIALAINMYLTDYDDLPGKVVDKMTADFWNNFGHSRGRVMTTVWPAVCNQARHADPYLRIPVILEDYIKNREIWKCPSARVIGGPYNIIPMGRDGLWLNNFIDHAPWYPGGPDVQVCNICWPSGWGGDVTDGFVQGHPQFGLFEHGWGNPDNKVFTQGIAYNDSLSCYSMKRWKDVAKTICVGDAAGGWLSQGNQLAYPDVFNLSGCGVPDPTCTGGADWTNCTWTQRCGLDIPNMIRFFKDPVFRKSYARHLGGSNLGFLDGHAKWYPAEEIITRGCGTADPLFEGELCPCWYPNLVVTPT